MHEALIGQDTTLFWFRRDLRIVDNAGLYHALKENQKVLCIFIFDTQILDKLDDKSDKRVEFIHHRLHALNGELRSLGSSLLVLYGDPVDIFETLTFGSIYANHDYEPYARQRDGLVAGICSSKGAKFRTFKDQVIFDKDEIRKDDGTPYTVFTPYSVKWKAKLHSRPPSRYNVEPYLENLKLVEPLSIPSLQEIGFNPTGTTFPEKTVALEVVRSYKNDRDFPGFQSTTRLGVHLRFGSVSIRELVQLALRESESWLNELIWRDFYHMILWHFPLVDKAFKAPYDNIRWRNRPEEFEAWCKGRTGYPIVDAGMRELNETGFMHNRVRMIVASFLTKHLLIDWRWGEAYFAKKLLDFDLASNNGGWQWASGSGCDAAPYFRIFNPYLQQKNFDPKLSFIRRWVPELGTTKYPLPIVEHGFARARALSAYSAALTGKE